MQSFFNLRTARKKQFRLLWAVPLFWVGVGAIALLLLGSGWFLGKAESLPATVDYAKSGQTLELLYPLSADYPVMTVRLEGIQAADRQQVPWGPAAQQYLAQFNHQTATITPTDDAIDTFDRLWANVWVKGVWVNEAMVAAGHAWVDRDRLIHLSPTEGHHLLYAQEYARLQGLGIWNAASPLRETASTFRQRR